MSGFQDALKNSLPPAGDFEPCFAFSLHKAGSTLMHKMIGEVCRSADIPAISIPDILFKEGAKEADWSGDEDLASLIAPGRVYYGFRFLPAFLPSADPAFRSRPMVLLVRDPRDALVSQYFSFGGKHLSHRLPDKNQAEFIERARSTSNLDIDEYVLRSAKNYLQKLEMYRASLDIDAILLRRYEDIYFDKRKFLGEIFSEFRLEVPTSILDAVAERNDVRPDSEQLGHHIRKGAPGDHRGKLQPQTIAKLNETFRDIGTRFGYDLD